MLTVAVLGPVDVRRDGEPVTLPSGKTTEVLVRLALDAGVPVRADLVVKDLWADAGVMTGRNTLQSKVSQLRRALGRPELITSGHGGYTLHVDRDCVDALRVAALAGSATALRRSGNFAAAAEVSATGLALFRGEVLGDAGDAPWCYPHRSRLQQIRLGLHQDHLAARVQLGAGADVIGELETLVGQYPLHEGLWFWLITALYRNGRQAEALEAYGRVRKALVADLGLEPGPDLQELEQQVLHQDLPLPSAPPPDPSSVDRQPVGHPPAGNLPRLSAPLIGRVADLAAVRRTLDRSRLVTLVGTPGVGKTRLAIEAARQVRFPGGVWLVRLDAVDTGAPVGQAVAETMNTTGERALFERVAGPDTLLVLDNCEHLVDAVADLAGRLLDAAPALRVLATSQLPLGLDGETVHPVTPLPMADSIALFLDRATAVRPLLELDDEARKAVAGLCFSLDGLPLAIELAAARMKSLSVQGIARRLDDRFALLQDPTSRRPQRRRALAAAIAWSYDLLFPDDQRTLCALSCFSGGAPLDAAQQVVDALGVPPAAADDAIGRLVDRSLVELQVTGRGDVRYALLDSIRVFAADRLRESGDDTTASAAHAEWIAEAADDCAAAVRGPGQPRCLTFVREERSNIDTALAWTARHRPAAAVRIANGFGWTWVVLGDGAAGAERVRGALDAGGSQVAQRDRAVALLLSGWLEASAGDLGRAQKELDRALDLAVDLAYAELTADAARHLAFLHLQQRRPDLALSRTEQSLGIDRAGGRTWEVAAGLLLGASASMMTGDTARAAGAADEALLLLEPLGDSWGQVHGEAMLGAIAQADGRFEDAARALARAAASSGRLGFLGQAAYHLTRLGRVHQQAGNDPAAVETLAQAIEAAQRDGDLRMATTAKINLARVWAATGRQGDALALLQEADAWYRRSGGGDGALLTRALLLTLSPPGPGNDTAGPLRAVLDEARLVQDREVEQLALDALARAPFADRGAVTGRFCG